MFYCAHRSSFVGDGDVSCSIPPKRITTSSTKDARVDVTTLTDSAKETMVIYSFGTLINLL